MFACIIKCPEITYGTCINSAHALRACDKCLLSLEMSMKD